MSPRNKSRIALRTNDSEEGKVFVPEPSSANPTGLVSSNSTDKYWFGGTQDELYLSNIS